MNYTILDRLNAVKNVLSGKITPDEYRDICCQFPPDFEDRAAVAAKEMLLDVLKG